MSKRLFLVIIFLLGIPLTASAFTKARAPEVKVFNTQGEQLRNITVFPENFKGGVSVVACDFDHNGKDEIVVGAGPGGGPHVKIIWPYSLKVKGFFAYDQSFRKGINVACGDLNGDGEIEIVTGASQGGGPHIRIFDQDGNQKFTPGFFAFDQNLLSGVNIAVGDVDGDGKDEIVAAPGSTGGAHVRVFDYRGVYENLDFFPFRPGDRGGVSLAVGNVDGGPESEIIMAIQKFGKAWTKIYKANRARTILGEFYAYPDFFQGGINLAAGDIDQDGFAEVIAAPTRAGGPHIRSFEAYGEHLNQDFFAYEPDFRGGVNLTTGDINGDGHDDLITAPSQWVGEGRPEYYKYIEVNLTEQRLDTYENDQLVKSFLISSGVKGKFDTPKGEFNVFLKRESTDMTWFYGPDNPDNYDLEDVPHVLSFYGPYTIHGTYWHNNFGTPMSHGCVNASRKDAEWLYQWASWGIPVWIHD